MLLRFATYNIRKGKGASGRAQMTEALGKALAEHSLDLVLCQEVFHGTEGPHQTDLLSQALGLSLYYGRNKDRRVGHHGNATFARGEVDHSENFDISTNALERRGVLYTRMLWHGQRVHVFNAHLGLNQGQRRRQIEQIGALIKEKCANEPVLLAGDFNDWNGRLDPIVTRELGLTNAFPEAVRTWHAQRPLFNLDRVYVRHLRPTQPRCMSGQPWRDLSDHLPLFVELSIANG